MRIQAPTTDSTPINLVDEAGEGMGLLREKTNHGKLTTPLFRTNTKTIKYKRENKLSEIVTEEKIMQIE